MNTESILHKTHTEHPLLFKEGAGGGPPGTAIRSDQPPPNPRLEKAGELSRKRWLKMATSSADRAGDVLMLEGMDATNFKSNPQFLWQHGGSGALINTIGKVLDLQIANGALFAHVEYDTSDLAQNIFELSERGMLPANSIGFRPLEWHANDFGGNTFTKWELIECSKVELPMNPEAVDTRALPIVTSSEITPSIDDAAEWLCCNV